MIHVAAKFHPFQPHADRLFHVGEGWTLAAIVDRCGVPDWFDATGHVAIRNTSGEMAEIDRAHWHRVRPKDGTLVAVYCLPLGGGGGGGSGRKDVLTTVATLAILAGSLAIPMFGVPFLGAAFAAGTIGAQVAGAAFGIVGSLALKALAPPPVAVNNKADQGFQIPQVAGVNANALARGAQLSSIAGTMIASPPYLARPYTSFSGGETYAHAIVGLWGEHAISSVEVNGTDSALIPDLEMETREGLSTDAAVTVAPATVIEDRTVGQLSEFALDRTDTTQLDNQSTPSASMPIWHYSTSDGEADRINIRVSFPSGLAKGTTRIGVPLHIAIRRVGDVAWINLPEIHFSDPDASSKPIRQQIEIIWNSRVPNNAVWNDNNLLTYAVLGRCGVAAYSWVPDAYFQYSTGYPQANNAQIDSDGCKIYLGDSTFPRGEYEVRVMRGLAYVWSTFVLATSFYGAAAARFFDADTGVSPVVAQIAQRDMVSAGVVEVVQTWRDDYPIRATGLTLIAIKGRGLSLESISATFQRRCLLWTGAAWGTTATATANPAAVYRQMLLDYDAVTGRLPAVLRDDAGLGTWYDACAAAGYEVNAVIDGGTLLEQLQMVAAAGWAVPRFGETWGVIVERDRSADTPVQLMTPLNGRGLSWEKNFDALPHAIAAEFNDASRNYKTRDDVIVYRDGYGPLTATDIETVTYKGFTDAAKVTARAGLDMKQLIHRRTTYKLDQWIETIMARRGDLVMLSHDAISRYHGFARVKAVAVSGGNVMGFTLDSTVDISAGPRDIFSLANIFAGGIDIFSDSAASAVAVRKSDGSTMVMDISETAATATLTLVTAVADDGKYVAGCIVAVGLRGTTARRCVVFSVQRNGFEEATVTLVDEAPQLHAA